MYHLFLQSMYLLFIETAEEANQGMQNKRVRFPIQNSSSSETTEMTTHKRAQLTHVS